MPETIRLAVTQSTVHQDPTDAALLRTSGAEVRSLLKQAAGARLVHFTEGALSFPSKFVMSSLGPEELGESDWTKARWDVLAEELDSIRSLVRELSLWVVLPTIHAVAGARPHNSIHVISDRGELVARYDERMLSTTKATWMYAPGTQPVTFEVDGFRFGLALGLDVLFPEIFTEYDDLGVDAVLVSYCSVGVGPNENIAVQARGAAANNTVWVSLAVPALPESGLTSGVIDPRGQWTIHGPAEATPAVVATDLTRVDVSAVGREFRQRTRERVNG